MESRNALAAAAALLVPCIKSELDSIETLANLDAARPVLAKAQSMLDQLLNKARRRPSNWNRMNNQDSGYRLFRRGNKR
jgi:hypothetical protein